MTAQPARRRPPLQAVAEPETEPVLGTPAEQFGRRMFDFADLLMGAHVDKRKFGHLMHDIAEDFPHLTEGEYYDRVRAATDLLPMTKAQALKFAEKIRKKMIEEFGETDAES